MIHRKYFTKPFNVNDRIQKYSDIYAIQSGFDDNVVYGVSGDKFAVIAVDGYASCLFDEVLDLAKMMIPEIGWEIVEIYYHVKELREKYRRQI